MQAFVMCFAILIWLIVIYNMPILTVCVHRPFLCCLDDNCDDESTRIYLYNTSKQIGINCKDSFALIPCWTIIGHLLILYCTQYDCFLWHTCTYVMKLSSDQSLYGLISLYIKYTCCITTTKTLILHTVLYSDEEEVEENL